MAVKPSYEELEKKIADLERELGKRPQEKALLETEQKQRLAIFDNIKEMFYVVDPKSYEILYTSKYFQKLFGRDPSGGICYRVLKGFDRPCDYCRNETILKEKNKLHKNEYHDASTDRYYIVNECIIKWPDGRDVKLGLTVDITKRVRAEKKLQESQDQYRSLVENIDLGVTLIDSNHNIIMTNSAQGKMFNKEAKDFVGKKCFREFEKRDAVCPHCPGLRSMDTGQPAEVETKGIRDDGTHFDARIHSFPSFDKDGSITGFIEVVEDVTERKLAEKELITYRNHLEELVAERTLELKKVNEKLQREITERRQAEDSLLRIGKAVESVSDAIGLSDSKGRHFYHNKAFSELFGYNTPEELEAAGGGIVAFADPIVAIGAFVTIQRLGSWSDEIEVVKKSGEKFPARVRVSVIKDDAGNFTGFFGIASDISERKQAEKALQESEKRFRALVETSSDWIWEADPKGNFTYASPTVERLLGYRPEEVIGKTPYDLVPEDEAKRISEIVKRSVKKLQPFKVPENTNIHKDGHHLIVETSGVPFFDSEDNLVGWIGLSRDITERKIAEDAVRRSEERLSNVRRAVNEGIWEWDVYENKLTYVSDRLNEIMGFEQEKPVSFNNWSERIHPDHKDRVLEQLWKTVNGESVFDIDYKYKSNGGEYIWLNTSGMLVTKGGEKNPRLVGSIRDITERKLAEKEKRELQAQLQQAQKMEALGTLAGGIAHDFNNLLQSIIVNAELGFDELDEQRIDTKRLQQILKASQRAKELVKQIVAFSRQKERKQSPLKLTPLVKEALKLLRATLPATIEVRQNIRARKDTIMADPTQMNQIIMNLCTNAAHAMQKKGGVLEVGLIDVEFYYDTSDIDADIRPGKYVILSVSDTGQGMDKAVMERIFDPFFTTKKPGEGTGMGLSVVHGIVKACKGTIIVDSELGKGTLFQVFLPGVEESVEPIAESPEPILKGSERILVVDDEKMIIDSLSPALENLGYKVVAKTDSIEAMNTFRAAPEDFDLVITDQTMPLMTGAELAKRIMSIRPDIPIIICTGFTDLITPEEAKAMGIREYLVKPIVTNEISTAVRRVLDSGD